MTEQLPTVVQRALLSFSEVKENELEIVRLEKELQKQISRLCSWEEPQDVAEYKSAFRSEKRIQLLNRLVPKRICPVCRQIFLNSKSWKVNYAKTSAVCKSCNPPLKKVPDLSGLISAPETTYCIDYKLLTSIREACGLSGKRMAFLCGMSRQHYSKIECGVTLYIKEKYVKAIFEALIGVIYSGD